MTNNDDFFSDHSVMLVASDRLISSPDAISVIATSLGDDSESAFSTAFKRTLGHSPRNYARQELALLPSA